jgi:hypothetical protein
VLFGHGVGDHRAEHGLQAIERPAWSAWVWGERFSGRISVRYRSDHIAARAAAPAAADLLAIADVPVAGPVRKAIS